MTEESGRPLEGAVALVTGASRGIGRAVAEALAANGASIALACSRESEAAHDAVRAVEGAGSKAVLLTADIADPAAASGLVARTLEHFQELDIVVNNAGITADNLALRMSDEEWSRVIAVDLTAAFHICRAALKVMLRKRRGRIINVSSVSGVTGNPGQANYSAAKAGLIGLTKSLAREVGSRQITVNAVAPGFIDTEMTDALPPAVRDGITSTVPLGRLGTAAEVAAAIRFLALPEAAYITGHVLHVDGGLAA